MSKESQILKLAVANQCVGTNSPSLVGKDLLILAAAQKVLLL